MKKLNELSEGSCGTVVAINGDNHFQSRITSIGLTMEAGLKSYRIPKSSRFFCITEIRWLQSIRVRQKKSWWR